jgi:hypothetical protein
VREGIRRAQGTKDGFIWGGDSRGGWGRKAVETPGDPGEAVGACHGSVTACHDHDNGAQALCSTVDTGLETRSSIECWVEYTGDLIYEFDTTLGQVNTACAS